MGTLLTPGLEPAWGPQGLSWLFGLIWAPGASADPSVGHCGLSDINIYPIKQRKRVCDEISWEILWVKQIYLLLCF